MIRGGGAEGVGPNPSKQPAEPLASATTPNGARTTAADGGRAASAPPKPPRLVDDALRYEPWPLVLEHKRLAVLFSAKAGCTFVVKWFFAQAGLLEEAEAYPPWIHGYRHKVYYRSDGYRPRAVLQPGMRVVKFVRNPYERAVSAYIHALRSRYEDGKLAASLGRPVDRRRRFSFREFVGHVEADSVTVHRCNPHHRSQIHRLEERGLVGPAHLIRVEQARDQVPRLERKLGLAPTDYEALRHSAHHTERVADGSACADRCDWHQARGARHRQFPPTYCFYDDDLLGRVCALYRQDFERYGYDPGEVPSPPTST